MEIKYQTDLYNCPVISPATGIFSKGNYSFELIPLTIEQIIDLEITYNDGKQFPLSLRELLYLAGQSCDVLDYGLSNLQKEMQEDVREWLTVYKFTMQRPFFVIDVYGGSDTFAFVYLDEEVNDPKVVVANLDNSPNSWLTTSQFTLSDFVGNRINRLKNGINPHLIFISSNSKRNSA